MKTFLILLSLLFAASAIADPIPKDDEAHIRQVLGEHFKGLNVRSLVTTPVEGIYEVFSGSQIGYITRDAHYLFVNGVLVNLENMENLTEKRMAELTRIEFDKLPLADAITIKKGSGKYVFAVFSDPDCPYCRALEAELAKPEYDNYTEYVFTFPLDIHEGAKAKAVSAWCSQDRVATWVNMMSKNVEPTPGTCENPVERNIALANKLGVSATPTMYGADGKPLQLPALLAGIRGPGK